MGYHSNRLQSGIGQIYLCQSVSDLSNIYKYILGQNPSDMDRHKRIISLRAETIVEPLKRKKVAKKENMAFQCRLDPRSGCGIQRWRVRFYAARTSIPNPLALSSICFQKNRTPFFSTAQQVTIKGMDARLRTTNPSY